MKKRILALIICSALVFSVAGCETSQTAEDVTDETVDEEDMVEEPETIDLGEQIEVNTEYGDFLLTIDDVKKSDWVERNGDDAKNTVAVLVECDIDNIDYNDPDNDYFWLGFYLSVTDDEGYIANELSYGYDDGQYATTLEIPAGSKGRMVVAYNCDINVQSLKINVNNQYILETQLEAKESATYLAYKAASDLCMDDLTKTSDGSFEYDGLVISDSEVSNIEDDTLYKAMAQQLESFYSSKDFYSSWGSDVIPLIWGFEKPGTWEELRPYVDDTKRLIARIQSLGNVMSTFDSLTVTEGTYDYVAGEFSFTINDLTKAAEELGITETALGYILAYINTYGATATFDGNSCDIDVKWYGAERAADSSIYTVYENFEPVDLKERMEWEGDDFYFYQTDDGIQEVDLDDVCTDKGIRLGETSDAVIFTYGGELLPYDKSNDIIYVEGGELRDADDAPQFDIFKYYIIYTVEGYGDVVFYFNEDKLLYMIDFSNDVFETLPKEADEEVKEIDEDQKTGETNTSGDTEETEASERFVAQGTVSLFNFLTAADDNGYSIESPSRSGNTVTAKAVGPDKTYSMQYTVQDQHIYGFNVYASSESELSTDGFTNCIIGLAKALNSSLSDDSIRSSVEEAFANPDTQIIYDDTLYFYRSSKNEISVSH